MLGNANGIDLNNASLHDLDRIGGVGRVLATRIIEQRPFRRWEDLKKIEGIDDTFIDDLRGSGAKLGRPQARKTKKLLNENLRPRKPPAKEGNAASRGKRATNIFSTQGRP